MTVFASRDQISCKHTTGRHRKKKKIDAHPQACPLQTSLRAGLLLLLQKERQQRHTRHLHNLEPHTGQITYRVTGATKPRHQHLVIVLDVAERPIAGHKRSNLLAILDQLHPNRLPDSRVGLLGLNTNPLQNNALGVRGAGKGVGLQGRGGMLPRILLVVPYLLTAVVLELTGGADTRGLPERRVTRRTTRSSQ